jgi:hypothetical protein
MLYSHESSTQRWRYQHPLFKLNIVCNILEAIGVVKNGHDQSVGPKASC